jgi:predicted transposase YbfD/YdcC
VVPVTPEQVGFPHAAAIVEAQRESTDKRSGQTSHGRRLFVLSDPLSARDALLACREHWGIENKNHHPRDATWLEDKTRARTGHTAANLALLRGLVLILWRRTAPNLPAPAFVQRNQRHPDTLIRHICTPLTS